MSKKNLVILDADFLLYYATMGNKVLDEFGNPIRQDNKFVYTDKIFEEVIQAADSIINNILSRVKADCYIGYLGNSKSFRYNIDSEYKANRKNLIKPLWFQELKDYLNKEWNFVLLDNGLEADDAVNIARNKFKNSYNVFIATSDKDLIKCIPGKYINAKDLAIIRTNKDKATEAFWTSMIVGDSIDNIKGIPKCGKKFAENLFSKQDNIVLFRDLEDKVQIAYQQKFKENWLIEYNKNYQLLYILDEFEGFDPVINELKEEANGGRVRDSSNEETSIESW